MPDDVREEIESRMEDKGRDTQIPPPVPTSFTPPEVYTGGRLLKESTLAGTNPGSETKSVIGFVFLDANDALVSTSTFNHFELVSRYLRAVDVSPTRAVPFKSGTFGPVELPGGGGFASKVQDFGMDLSKDDILFTTDITPYTALYEVAYTVRAAAFPEDRHLRYIYRNDDGLQRDLFRMQDLYQELRFAGVDPGSFRE